MSAAEFLACKRKATAPGRMDIVRVICMSKPLPDEKALRRVLDAYRDEDVTAVVLHKGQA